MNHIVSFSGGKDSTAMLLKLLEENYPVDYIVFADTGVEFPEMYQHIEKVNEYIKKNYGKEISIVKPKHSFWYYIYEYKRKKGMRKGLPYGFPTAFRRWCTTYLKFWGLKKFYKDKKPYKEYIGIAFDEKKRMKGDNGLIYPLVEWQMIEKDCLEYCYQKGFNWSGLYEKFERVSCWVCPLQRKKELKVIIEEYPHLWEKVKKAEKHLKEVGLEEWKYRPNMSTDEVEQWVKGGKK